MQLHDDAVRVLRRWHPAGGSFCWFSRLPQAASIAAGGLVIALLAGATMGMGIGTGVASAAANPPPPVASTKPSTAAPVPAPAAPASPAVSPSPATIADPGPTAVAIVNGHAITERDLYNALLDIAGPGVLDQLILVRLIDDAAEKAGVSVDATLVSREYDQIRARFATADEFDQALQQAGLTPTLLREQIRVNALLTQLVSPLVKVTDAEVQAFYDQNKQGLGQPAQVRARHILVKTQQEADELVKQLRAGADFAKLAKEHSIDSGSAANGGELGSFTQDQMVKEFSQAAFSLPVGQISDPVKSQYGYHIIQVEERKEAQIPTLDQARPTITETLRTQKLNQMVPLWLQQLQATASIQRLWPPTPPVSQGPSSQEPAGTKPALASPAPGSR